MLIFSGKRIYVVFSLLHLSDLLCPIQLSFGTHSGHQQFSPVLSQCLLGLIHSMYYYIATGDLLYSRFMLLLLVSLLIYAAAFCEMQHASTRLMIVSSLRLVE